MIIYKTTLLFDNNGFRALPKINLDAIDLRILNLLAKNGRLSYSSIGHTIGLTTKSVKSRVDRMFEAKVIEKFLTKVNPSAIGYSKSCALALRKNDLRQELVDRINLVGEIRHQFEVMGGVMGFDIAIKDETEDKIELLLSSFRPALLGMIQSHTRGVSQRLTQIDYAIIKQLVRDPRVEIQDISVATTISPKTVRRRLDKMLRNHVLEFSIQPNPDAMSGYIVFYLEIKTKSRNYHQKVLQKIYEEFGHFMLSSDVSSQEDRIGIMLGSEDAIGIESIRSKIESVDGVQQTNAFLVIKLTCPQAWILKAIERRLAEYAQNEKSISQAAAS
jgi:Lrp/AsnC family leucine-responsive transcriptional regulator